MTEVKEVLSIPWGQGEKIQSPTSTVPIFGSWPLSRYRVRSNALGGTYTDAQHRLSCLVTSAENNPLKNTH